MRASPAGLMRGGSEARAAQPLAVPPDVEAVLRARVRHPVDAVEVDDRSLWRLWRGRHSCRRCGGKGLTRTRSFCRLARTVAMLASRWILVPVSDSFTVCRPGTSTCGGSIDPSDVLGFSFYLK